MKAIRRHLSDTVFSRTCTYRFFKSHNSENLNSVFKAVDIIKNKCSVYFIAQTVIKAKLIVASKQLKSKVRRLSTIDGLALVKLQDNILPNYGLRNFNCCVQLKLYQGIDRCLDYKLKKTIQVQLKFIYFQFMGKFCQKLLQQLSRSRSSIINFIFVN